MIYDFSDGEIARIDMLKYLKINFKFYNCATRATNNSTPAPTTNNNLAI
jgi:hypothetical protein